MTRPSRKTVNPNPSYCLVIRSGGVGDFILILPVLDALRGKWPSCRIEILGHLSIARLAVESGHAHEVHSIDKSNVARLFHKNLAKDSRLGNWIARFDLVLSFLIDSEGNLERNIKQIGPRYLHLPRPMEGKGHATKQFVKKLGALNIQVNPPDQINLSLAQTDLTHHSISTWEESKSYILHCGSGSIRKNWSVLNFSRVVRKLYEFPDYRVALVEGPADRLTVNQLRNHLDDLNLTILRNLSLIELSKILKNCDLFIGNDSGISHLAAASGCPVLALFGPTNPDVWRPLGPLVKTLSFEEATVAQVIRSIHDFPV